MFRHQPSVAKRTLLAVGAGLLALAPLAAADQVVTVSDPSASELRALNVPGAHSRFLKLPNGLRVVQSHLPAAANANVTSLGGRAVPVRQFFTQKITRQQRVKALLGRNFSTAAGVSGQDGDWDALGLWGLNRIRGYGASIGRTASVAASSGQRKSRVCVVDSGISEMHSRLKLSATQSVVKNRFNFAWDPYLPVNLNPSCNGDQSARCADDDFADPHGSHVAGIIAARDRFDGYSVKGVAADAVELYNAKVIGPHFDGSDINYSGYAIDVALGILWCAGYSMTSDSDIIDYYGFAPATIAPVDVINLSLGTFYDDDTIAFAVGYALDRGIQLVAAAGNTFDEEGDPNDPFNGVVLYPAMYEGVLAVSATDGQDALASFSARGSRIDISAPGVDIVSSLTKEPSGEYFGLYSGTSMAAPFVAGTLALQLATSPFRWELSATDLGLPDSQQGRLGLVQVPDSIKH